MVNMIEDKKLGVKIAENEEEAIWYNTVENLKQSIQILKGRIARAEKDLTKSAREIEQKFKKGAKAVIKQSKNELITQKELLKFCKTKLN